MKATPIQKYALRVLIAYGSIPPPERSAWNALEAVTAERLIAPFGGIKKSILNTVLSVKSTKNSNPAASRSEEGKNLPVKSGNLEIE